MVDDEVNVAGDSEDTNESEVVEGEVVQENPKADSADENTGAVSDNGASEVLNLESMIKTNNAQVTKLSAELNEARQMLKDAFDNDTTYRDHAEAAKDANKVKNATKAQILKRPEVAQIATNVKVLTSELAELKEALSDYLKEFNRLSGITEIEDETGELLEIVYVAKLVKKRA